MGNRLIPPTPVPVCYLSLLIKSSSFVLLRNLLNIDIPPPAPTSPAPTPIWRKPPPTPAPPMPEGKAPIGLIFDGLVAVGG